MMGLLRFYNAHAYGLCRTGGTHKTCRSKAQQANFALLFFAVQAEPVHPSTAASGVENSTLIDCILYGRPTCAQDNMCIFRGLLGLFGPGGVRSSSPRQKERALLFGRIPVEKENTPYVPD